jgi:hypothetical protein
VEEMYKKLISNSEINIELKKIKDELGTLTSCGRCDTYIAYDVINERIIHGLKSEIIDLKKLLNILITTEEERGGLKIPKL